VLSIVAPCNGSGKTSLLLTLLGASPGAFTAVKASTVYRDGRHCPREGSGCACRRLAGPFTVIDDPAVLAQRGTDTGRMVACGAARTLWCLCRPGAHAAMWRAVTEGHLRSGEPALVEGGGVLAVLEPEAIVMVASPGPPRDRWKDSTRALAERASLVVVNRPEGAAASSCEALAADLSSWTRARVIIQDVTRPLTGWEDSTLERLASSLAPGAPISRGRP
jgi:hypothetical protein